MYCLFLAIESSNIATAELFPYAFGSLSTPSAYQMPKIFAFYYSINTKIQHNYNRLCVNPML